MEKYSVLMQTCPLFAHIDQQNIPALLSCLGASEREYEKGAFIFSAGDSANGVGIVLSGGVLIAQEDYWGNRTLLAHIAPGSLFGESFSCADVGKLPISVIAAEKTQVLLMQAARIVQNCPKTCGYHTELIRNMMRNLATKNVQLTEKIQVITRRTTREKLLSYLSEQAIHAGSSHFTIPFNRQELADYLSVERSAMSAELSRMMRDGLIETYRSEFKLL